MSNDTKSTHTPGPWTIDTDGTDEERGGPIAIRDADGRFGIASIWHQSGGAIDESMNEANAALIAAAPDLLAALKGFDTISGALHQIMWTHPNADLANDLSDAIELVRAAIAKAEGRQP